MTTFQDRERSFEAKYAHDEEFRFLVTARRDKLFAQWAAEQLRLEDEAKSALTAAVLAVKDGGGHDERLLAHIEKTFGEHGRTMTRPELAKALERCAGQAREQLLTQSRPA